MSLLRMWNRITDSGIERIRMVSEYASEEDEFHATTAVNVYAAEHCWVRNVVAEHFSFCCVDMLDGAKNITVDSCSYLTPKARTIGSRKYGFYMTMSVQMPCFGCRIAAILVRRMGGLV